MTERRRILYGRRRGRRLRPGQRDLVNRLLPDLEIAPDTAPLTPAGLFHEGVGDLWLEIGFGGGEHLAWQAQQHPDIGMIGCEPFLPGTAKLVAKIERCGIRNIRLYRDDARLLLDRLPDNSLGRVFILFPDPWPKARHHKRRVVNANVLSSLAATMRDGAELRVATDDAGYLEWILELLRRHDAFAPLGPEYAHTRPENWPPTRFEEKAKAAGRVSAFMHYMRRPRDSRCRVPP